jgi:sugar lactone lactonase YvrE
MKSIENNHDCKSSYGRNKTGDSLYFLFPLLMAALMQIVLPAPLQAAGVDRGIMSVEFLYSIEYTSGRSEKLGEPTDIFFDRKKNELYIVDARTGKIYVYDNNGMYLQDIKLTGVNSPPGMLAVDGTGNIYVGYVNSPKISIFDFRGVPLEHLDLPGIVDAPGNTVHPFKLSSGPDGRVYSLKNTGGVVKIDTNGESHEEIDISGDGRPNVIMGMGMDSKGRFLFTDMRPYSVVVFDPGKKTFQRFGSAGVLYGQIVRPSGVTADDAGHIFVLSLTVGKVSCFDKEGNFIEEFGGLGREYGRFFMPTRIASDGKDRLYVLEQALKRVQVFRVEFLKERREVVQENTLKDRS